MRPHLRSFGRTHLRLLIELAREATKLVIESAGIGAEDERRKLEHRSRQKLAGCKLEKNGGGVAVRSAIDVAVEKLKIARHARTAAKVVIEIAIAIAIAIGGVGEAMVALRLHRSQRRLLTNIL